MKRVIALSLTMMLVIGGVFSSEVNAQSTSRPIIKVEKITNDELIIGQEESIQFEFNNIGSKFAIDMNFSITFPEGSPLISKSVVQNGYRKSFNPNTKAEFEFDFTSDAMAKAGVYPMYIKGNYVDQDGNNYTMDESIYVTLKDDDQRVRFELVYDKGEELFADTNYSKHFTLRNTGNRQADFVAVKLDSDKSGGFRAQDSEPVYLETIFKKTGNEFDYDFYVPAGVSGYQETTFTIDYVDGGVHKEEKMTLYYNVMTQEEKIIINKVSMSTESVVADSQFTMTVAVENLSTKEAKNVRVAVIQDKDVTVVSDSYKLLEHLGAGEIEEIQFDFKAVKDLPTANYPIKIEVVYDEGNKKIEASSGIYVKNNKSENKSAPRMAVTSFKLDQEQVFVGDDFDLTMTIANTSSEKSIKNLKVIMDVKDSADASNSESATSALIPVGTSNSIYVGNLGAGEQREVEIPYKVMANAKGGMYSLDVRFEYDDRDNNAFKDSEVINLPVYEKNKLTLSDVRVGKILDSGYTLELDFYNTGKININNMMVDIEGDFETVNSNYYVGDFLSGRMDVYSVQIKGSMPELVEGKIHFTYDDTFGESASMDKAFSIKNDQEEAISLNADGSVMAKGLDGVNDLGGDPIGEDASKSKSGMFIAVALGIGLIVGAIVFFRKRKKVS